MAERVPLAATQEEEEGDPKYEEGEEDEETTEGEEGEEVDTDEEEIDAMVRRSGGLCSRRQSVDSIRARQGKDHRAGAFVARMVYLSVSIVVVIGAVLAVYAVLDKWRSNEDQEKKIVAERGLDIVLGAYAVLAQYTPSGLFTAAALAERFTATLTDRSPIAAEYISATVSYTPSDAIVELSPSAMRFQLTCQSYAAADNDDLKLTPNACGQFIGLTFISEVAAGMKIVRQADDYRLVPTVMATAKDPKSSNFFLVKYDDAAFVLPNWWESAVTWAALSTSVGLALLLVLLEWFYTVVGASYSAQRHRLECRNWGALTVSTVLGAIGFAIFAGLIIVFAGVIGWNKAAGVKEDMFVSSQTLVGSTLADALNSVRVHAPNASRTLLMQDFAAEVDRALGTEVHVVVLENDGSFVYRSEGCGREGCPIGDTIRRTVRFGSLEKGSADSPRGTELFVSAYAREVDATVVVFQMSDISSDRLQEAVDDASAVTAAIVLVGVALVLSVLLIGSARMFKYWVSSRLDTGVCDPVFLDSHVESWHVKTVIVVVLFVCLLGSLSGIMQRGRTDTHSRRHALHNHIAAPVARSYVAMLRVLNANSDHAGDREWVDVLNERLPSESELIILQRNATSSFSVHSELKNKCDPSGAHASAPNQCNMVFPSTVRALSSMSTASAEAPTTDGADEEDSYHGARVLSSYLYNETTGTAYVLQQTAQSVFSYRSAFRTAVYCLTLCFGVLFLSYTVATIFFQMGAVLAWRYAPTTLVSTLMVLYFTLVPAAVPLAGCGISVAQTSTALDTLRDTELRSFVAATAGTLQQFDTFAAMDTTHITLFRDVEAAVAQQLMGSKMALSISKIDADRPINAQTLPLYGPNELIDLTERDVSSRANADGVEVTGTLFTFTVGTNDRYVVAATLEDEVVDNQKFIAKEKQWLLAGGLALIIALVLFEASMHVSQTMYTRGWEIFNPSEVLDRAGEEENEHRLRPPVVPRTTRMLHITSLIVHPALLVVVVVAALMVLQEVRQSNVAFQAQSALVRTNYDLAANMEAMEATLVDSVITNAPAQEHLYAHYKNAARAIASNHSRFATVLADLDAITARAAGVIGNRKTIPEVPWMQRLVNGDSHLVIENRIIAALFSAIDRYETLTPKTQAMNEAVLNTTASILESMIAKRVFGLTSVEAYYTLATGPGSALDPTALKPLDALTGVIDGLSGDLQILRINFAELVAHWQAFFDLRRNATSQRVDLYAVLEDYQVSGIASTFDGIRRAIADTQRGDGNSARSHLQVLFSYDEVRATVIGMCVISGIFTVAAFVAVSNVLNHFREEDLLAPAKWFVVVIGLLSLGVMLGAYFSFEDGIEYAQDKQRLERVDADRVNVLDELSMAVAEIDSAFREELMIPGAPAHVPSADVTSKLRRLKGITSKMRFMTFDGDQQRVINDAVLGIQTLPTAVQHEMETKARWLTSRQDYQSTIEYLGDVVSQFLQKPNVVGRWNDEFASRLQFYRVNDPLPLSGSKEDMWFQLRFAQLHTQTMELAHFDYLLGWSPLDQRWEAARDKATALLRKVQQSSFDPLITSITKLDADIVFWRSETDYALQRDIRARITAATRTEAEDFVSAVRNRTQTYSDAKHFDVLRVVPTVRNPMRAEATLDGIKKRSDWVEWLGISGGWIMTAMMALASWYYHLLY